jgi:D-alanyl-D-alanine carboxypeptidase
MLIVSVWHRRFRFLGVDGRRFALGAKAVGFSFKKNFVATMWKVWTRSRRFFNLRMIESCLLVCGDRDVTVSSFMLWVRVRGFIFVNLLVAFATVGFVFGSPPAWAKTESYIIVDAETGAALSERNADAQTYPASLTKMMTLYLLFESLEQGKVRLDQQFTVSARAAAQAPSKLGLADGQQIAIRDLVLGIVTKSANDAAVVVAENLGGSEPGFAERMTQKARALGMTHTIYRNASGLPNPGQLTTARDLSRLALALYRDFPKEYAYFATEEFTYNGVTHANHNHLMQAFEGMDGIKTGYIRASGFNLAASAVRDNRRLVGVVMGGPSPHARDMEMAQLLNDAFASHGTAPPVLTAAVEADPEVEPNPHSFTRRAARALAKLSPISRAEAATPVQVPRGRHETAENWGIQVGAFAQEGAAQKAVATATAKLPALQAKTVQVLTPGQPAQGERYYRARLVGFSERDAERACHVLHKKHLQCAVVAVGATQQVAVAIAPRG